ncbi:MAG TPA: hypothetical protein PK336_05730 [Methanoculleus sp.]|nr:hypothetical protein [Methanoculleus sp.]
MSGGHISFIAAAVLLVIILASAGCAELPPGVSTGQSGEIPPTEEQSSGQGYNPGYLTPATPYPTAAPDVLAAPTLNRFSDTVPTTDPYVTIYQKKSKFEQTIEAYSFNLTRPPLIIEFDVEPKMITREKHTTSSYGDKDEIVVTQRYPSEDAWFRVIVRDSATGKILAEDGFGKGFSADTHKRIFVGRYGDYLLEFSGNEVTVDIQVRVGGV